MRVSQIEASSLFYTPQSLRDSSPILGEQLIATDNQQLIYFNSTLPIIGRVRRSQERAQI